MNVAGIDLSSFAIDIVLLDDDTNNAEWHHIDLLGQTPFERARSLRSRFVSRSWWEDKSVWLTGIEDPHSRAGHVAKALGLATGAVAALLPPEMIVLQLPVAEWKSLTIGRAAANKIDVAIWCNDHGFPTTVAEAAHLPQDAYDAYAIAWAVRALNNTAIERGAA